MRTEDTALQKCAAVLASIGIVTSGCAGLPSAEHVTAMSLSVNAAPLGAPRAAVGGDSEMGPRKTARAALPPAEMCADDITAIVCAVIIPVAVPIAAVVGAVGKASQKLPLEQVVELNRVTANVTSQLNLAASLSAALEAEAQRRGVTLNVRNAGADILVVPQSLSWDIKAGNKVALRMEIDVTVQVGGERGSRQVIYRSGSATVDDWIADNGQPIRQSLEETMIGASQRVWERILGPSPGGT